jgi:hypothetical protein
LRAVYRCAAIDNKLEGVMPRYHLSVHGASLAPGENGREFDTLAAAEHEAARTAAHIGLHRLPKDDACQTVVEVRDEHHRQVAVMTVSMRIDRPTSLSWAPSPWGA